VFGFVDFVYELLNIADIVITKCGASTIMEILLLQKVPIIVDYIWEQEKGNMEFVRDNNMGIYQKRISELPGIINRLLSDSDYYNFFLQNIKKAKLHTGTSQVAETIKTLI
ncbi:MAG: glycosyltransferase, partial [Ignavibacteriaceae bacterium]|nr:glycosyltransferase [Ignavibacteriaceae bacterium]